MRLVYHDVSELQCVVVTDVIGVVLHLREERGEGELQRLALEEEKLAVQSTHAPPPSASSAVSSRVAQLMGGLGLHAPTDGDVMGDESV